jgi:hypothetical protein
VAIEVDVYRPPARLGPRYPLWAKLAVLWGVTFVFLLVSSAVLSYSPTGGLLTLVLVVALCASVVLSYVQFRLVPGRTVWSNVLAARGSPVGDPEDAVRVADPEERRARRRLRRGAITRREYERIIARRRFVHGELSEEDYHEITRQLSYGDPPGRGHEPVRP